MSASAFGSYLDITPLGRQETWEDSPEGYPQTPPYKWWNWHDNYDAEASPHPQWVDIITEPSRSCHPQARGRGESKLNRRLPRRLDLAAAYVTGVNDDRRHAKRSWSP